MNDTVKLIEQMLQDKESVLGNIVELFVDQQRKGLAKYGTGFIKPDQWTFVKWIEHAQQECVDKLVYLEGIKQIYIKENKHDNLTGE